MSVANKPGVWYYISTYTCVLCGRTDVYRERQPPPRPSDFWDRHDDVEEACGAHFL